METSSWTGRFGFGLIVAGFFFGSGSMVSRFVAMGDKIRSIDEIVVSFLSLLEVRFRLSGVIGQKDDDS